MKKILFGNILLVLAGATNAAPVIYTDEALFLSDLASLGYSTISESFEDDAVWASSRTGSSSPSVTSQGIIWASNYTQNNIATGTVGGTAPDGQYALYSLPHGMTTDSGLYCDNAADPIPVQCYQNDGLKVTSETGDTLYAFGGRIDTVSSGKVTFLLDGNDINGNDTDNIDNWQREGVFADSWSFVGVIDVDGFQSAELLELRGKDFQQVNLFADDFSIGVGTAVPAPAAITGIWPADAAVGENISVFIFGENFTTDGTTEVYFNGIRQFLVSPVTTDMLIVRVLSVSASLYGPITVATPGDTVTSTQLFGVPVTGLSLTGAWPDTVSTGEWESILLFGNEFTTDGTTDVYFNGVRQFVVAPVNSEMLVVRVQGDALLSGAVTVTTPSGTVNSSLQLNFVP